MAISQSDRPIRVHTPLGKDKLFVDRLQGTEAISDLFQFRLDLLAENATAVEFEKLIGQPITVEIDLPDKKTRFIHGLCSRLSEGKRDSEFTRYRAEVVPHFWLLTRTTQCRIFQHQTVPEILKLMLKGIEVKWDLHGKYDPRDYCVQYRETDCAFAMRLMEEEGIYFYFTHDKKGHTLVIADTPQGHLAVVESPKVLFDDARSGTRPDLRITDWEKAQELRSGKVTLWDYCFELPGQNLEAQKVVSDSVPVGKVTHKLKLAGNENLELYDYPGAYAQRYDGIDAGGGEKASDLEQIFSDNQRTAKIRMEQEAAVALEIRGGGNCAQFMAGHKFNLERHFNADGEYVLLHVHHEARLPTILRSGESQSLEYMNSFTCLPAALPYRPPFKTPEPEIRGPQTATVVGPPGELIHCDKYGRIKVKFHWDRDEKRDDTSCWVRVSQNWGGAKWGGMFIPHVGQEVIVEFEEADPDRPLITGRVYNAAAMPPAELPGGKTKSVIRDHGGNEIIMEGHDGVQQIRMHSPYSESTFVIGAPHSPGDGFWFNTQAYMKMFIQKDWETGVMGKQDWLVNGNETMTIFGNSTHTINKRRLTTVGGNHLIVTHKHLIERTNGVRIESTAKSRNTIVRRNEVDIVNGKRDARVGKDLTEHVKGKHTETIDKLHSVTVKEGAKLDITGDYNINTGGKYLCEFAKQVFIDGSEDVNIVSMKDFNIDSESTKVQIRCGPSSLVLAHDGTIALKGVKILIEGDEVQINGKTFANIDAGKIDMGAKGKINIHGNRIDLN